MSTMEAGAASDVLADLDELDSVMGVETQDQQDLKPKQVRPWYFSSTVCGFYDLKLCYGYGFVLSVITYLMPFDAGCFIVSILYMHLVRHSTTPAVHVWSC